MIVKLNSSYHNKVIQYLKGDEEYNIFVIDDIQRYGYENYFFNVWADLSKRGNIEGILIKNFEYLTFYSRDKFDEVEFSKFINTLKFSEINGKLECLEKLEQNLKIKKKRVVRFCKLDKLSSEINYNTKFNIKKIRFGNINKVVRLYESINEFENTTVENIKNGLKSGRGYCIEEDRQVIAMAKSISEGYDHAMIVGVGTHPDYRNKGYATQCIIKICNELLNEGKIPYLFYDNLEAGKLYEKIGFKYIGKWCMYYKK